MSENNIQFTPGSNFSLGVEIEFQILAKNDFSMAHIGPTLVDNAPEILHSRIARELIKSMLEIQTGICTNLKDVENDLLQTCSLAEELAEEKNCLLYAASLHPFAMATEQELSDVPRYESIMQELQIIGRRFISQGLHVHVGLPDAETAIRVCNGVQAYLPIFLALSTSSPFYQGTDTGLMSYRTKLFEALPLAGIYAYMNNWKHFSDEVNYLIDHGIISSLKDLWWDARPSPGFGTIEIRICDLPVKFSDILALVSLIQGCVAWLAEDVQAAPPFRSYVIQANKWQAVRYGLEGRFVDPWGLLGTHAMNLRLAAMLLKKKVSSYTASLESMLYLSPLDEIIARGTGAHIQREIYNRSNDFAEVIDTVHQGFWK